MHQRLRPATFLALWVSSATSSMVFAQTQAASTPASMQLAYENSARGLKHLIQDALKAAKENNQAKLGELTASMVIPHPESWFSEAFGPQLGAVYARRYAQERARLPADLAGTFSELVAQKFTDVEVLWFTKACDSRADENEYPLLIARQEPEPISAVQLHHDNLSQTLRFFVYVDGGFRFAGNLQPPGSLNSGAAETPAPDAKLDSPRIRIKVGGSVQKARLIKQVPPTYPEEARRQYIQGDVLLRALITREGTVQDLRVIKGRCMLAEAAIKAVRQWRYAPTLLEGKPLEIETTIAVSFKLGPR